MCFSRFRRLELRAALRRGDNRDAAHDVECILQEVAGRRDDADFSSALRRYSILVEQATRLDPSIS